MCLVCLVYKLLLIQILYIVVLNKMCTHSNHNPQRIKICIWELHSSQNILNLSIQNYSFKFKKLDSCSNWFTNQYAIAIKCCPFKLPFRTIVERVRNSKVVRCWSEVEVNGRSLNVNYGELITSYSSSWSNFPGPI